MIRIHDLHTDLIGKICKLTSFGVELEKEYEILFGIGNYSLAKEIYEYCKLEKNKYSLMFIDERPIIRNGVTWYCFKSVGKLSEGDFYWFTLDQVIICDY